MLGVNETLTQLFHQWRDDDVRHSSKFMLILMEHGITIHVAINHAGVLMAFLSQSEARAWLETNPGEGANQPRVEACQVMFR